MGKRFKKSNILNSVRRLLGKKDAVIVPDAAEPSYAMDQFTKNIESRSVSKNGPGLKSVLIYFLSGFLAVWMLLYIGRTLIDSILDRIERNTIVHRDNSRIISGVVPQAENKVLLIYKNEDGELKRVLADADDLSAFAGQQIKKMEKKRSEVKEQVHAAVQKTNKQSFQSFYTRISPTTLFI